MKGILVDQFFDVPLSFEEEESSTRRIDAALAGRSAAWRRSYVSIDRRRMTSEFEAEDEATIRDVFREAHVSIDGVWEADVSAAEGGPAVMQYVISVLDDRRSPR